MDSEVLKVCEISFPQTEGLSISNMHQNVHTKISKH